MRLLYGIYYFFCFLSVGLLSCRTTNFSIALTFLLCFLLGIIAAVNKHQTLKKGCLHGRLFLWDILVVIYLSKGFVRRWNPSRIVASIAGKMHLTKQIFLVLAACVLGFIALFVIDEVTFYVLTWWKKRYNDKNELKRDSLRVIIFIAVSFLQNIMLQFSASGAFNKIFWENDEAILLGNFAIIIVLNLVLSFVIKKQKPLLFLTTIIGLVWSVANYFTVKFHGSPLYFSEFANIGAAMEVAHGYKFSIDVQVMIILALASVCALLIVCLPREQESMKKNDNVKWRLLLIAFGLFVSVYGYQRAEVTKTGWADLEFQLKRCGFLYETVFDIQKRSHPLKKPEGYEAGEIRETESDAVNKTGRYPDIILVLNESFCDLNYYSEIDTDVNPLDAFYNIDGAVYGYAAAPHIGGGTNDSEFELLTSKSVYLLGSTAPFTFLKDYQLKRSAVEYLEEFGYETAAFHCFSTGNYSRNTAYAAMGFDKIFLGWGSFDYLERNGNRVWLDSGNYADLLNVYNEMSDNPRFMYLLTFQNHGGWAQNDDELDTVHVRNIEGRLSSDVNEYLSSIKLSAEAFKELINNFKNTDREVVICMVGDHAPSFITSLPQRDDRPISNAQVNQRVVPYVIWSNFDFETSFYTEYASMTDLVPMVLKASGIPLSGFYKTVLELHEQVPIRMSTGVYVDREFGEKIYGDEGPCQELLKQYYFMEYNSLLREGAYQDRFFIVRKENE